MQHGAHVVCEVETTLRPSDMKRKNRHWYNFGDEYNRAEFEVRLIVRMLICTIFVKSPGADGFSET